MAGKVLVLSGFFLNNEKKPVQLISFTEIRLTASQNNNNEEIIMF